MDTYELPGRSTFRHPVQLTCRNGVVDARNRVSGVLMGQLAALLLPLLPTSSRVSPAFLLFPTYSMFCLLFSESWRPADKAAAFSSNVLT